VPGKGSPTSNDGWWFPSDVNTPLTVPTAWSAIARRKEEMGMDMEEEVRMILAVRALRKLSIRATTAIETNSSLRIGPWARRLSKTSR
jgi:hypothetical protein